MSKIVYVVVLTSSSSVIYKFISVFVNIFYPRAVLLSHITAISLCCVDMWTQTHTHDCPLVDYQMLFNEAVLAG